MEIIKHFKNNKEPHYKTEATINIAKIMKYLLLTEDIHFIKNDSIKKIEIFENDMFVKIYLANEMFIIDLDKLNWLDTHHMMLKCIYYSEECEKLWNLIKDSMDMFVVESWLISNVGKHLLNPDITYDRDFIYVIGKNTSIPTTKENYIFVSTNIKNWTDGGI